MCESWFQATLLQWQYFMFQGVMISKWKCRSSDRRVISATLLAIYCHSLSQVGMLLLVAHKKAKMTLRLIMIMKKIISTFWHKTQQALSAMDLYSDNDVNKVTHYTITICKKLQPDVVVEHSCLQATQQEIRGCFLLPFRWSKGNNTLFVGTCTKDIYTLHGWRE